MDGGAGWQGAVRGAALPLWWGAVVVMELGQGDGEAMAAGLKQVIRIVLAVGLGENLRLVLPAPPV